MTSAARPTPERARLPHHGLEARKASLWSRFSTLGPLAATVLLPLAFASARAHPKEPPFKYVGGTENVLEGCPGTLELTSSDLTYRCAQYSIRAPYESITLMEYRASLSRTVQKMKLKWKVHPPSGGGKKNRYFTVLYTQQGRTHAMVLEVLPEEMRPYLAEIDLKAGKRVAVQSHEEYQ